MEESGGDERAMKENDRNEGYALSNPKPKPNMHFASQGKKEKENKIKCHVS